MNSRLLGKMGSHTFILTKEIKKWEKIQLLFALEY